MDYKMNNIASCLKSQINLEVVGWEFHWEVHRLSRRIGRKIVEELIKKQTIVVVEDNFEK